MSVLELQNALQPWHLKRGLEDVVEYYDNLGFDFRSELERIFADRTEFAVLDVGCGAGRTVEEVAQHLKGIQPSVDLRAIGVDLNPLPYVDLDSSDYEMYDPEKDLGKDTRLSELKVGDAMSLPIDDNSIDFGYTVATLSYVEDGLKALEEAYRVLRPGGIFVFDPNLDYLIGDLWMEDILASPGAADVFEYIDAPLSGKGVLICRKKTNDTFSGFPFKLVEVKNGDFHEGDMTTVRHAAFYRASIYNRIWGEEVS